ncbi:MAG: FAD-dependent oxidoreductase, partial [Anaerolineaceae bacterium]|nr:FAD-dependent oxidoreductase [Anaerolineaceae bacterium]
MSSTTSLSAYDVIIIGAGSIGTPTAFSLANSGFSTLVIDSTASVGQGSNKRAIGGIRATHSDPTKIRLCLRSIEIFSQWKETYGDDIEWVKGGYCFVAYREQEVRLLQDLLITQKSLGLNINWLGRDELTEQVPGLNREGLLGGTLSPDDGNASPLLGIHAFYDHAKRAGAEFRFNEPVTRLIMDHAQVCGVETPKGQYFAKIVINAAGSAAHKVGLLAGMDIPVTSDCHEAAITEPVARFLDPMVVDIRPGPGSSNFYFYQHITGQIVFCITPNPNVWGENIEETSGFLPLVAPRLL